MTENNNSIISNNSSFLSNSSNATNNDYDENLEIIIEKINENLSSNNLFNIFLISKKLFYFLNTNKYSISKYFENYLKISEILLNIKKFFQQIYKNKYFILNYNKFNINEHIFINLISSSYINDYLSLSYFYTIIGSIILNENNIFLSEILNIIYNSFKNIDLPLSSYFSHNFFIKNFSENNILNILNNQSSIDILNKNIIEMNNIYNNYIYNNKNNKDLSEIQITLPILLIENINMIFSLNFINLQIFKEHFINNLLNLIDEKELYNATVLDFIINGLNEKYFIDNLELIFLKLKNLINRENNITNKMLKIQERAIKFFAQNNKIEEFENFNNIYDSSIIIIKAENEGNISITNFLIYIYSFLNFVLHCCKNKNIKEQFNYVNGILLITLNFLNNKKRKSKLNNNQNLNKIIKEIKNNNNNNNNEIDIESIDEKEKKIENLINEQKKIHEIEEKKNCIFTKETYKLYDDMIKLLLKSNINIYKLINLLKITNFFDENNKKLFCKKFIYHIIKKYELDNKSLLINSMDRIEFISILLKSLLSNNNFYIINTETELDLYIQINQIFEMIYHQNPETFLMLLISLSNIFNEIELNSENLKNLIFSYYKLLLNLIKKIEHSFINKKENNFEINDNYSTSETEAINNKINRLNSLNLKRKNNFELIKNKKRSNSNNNNNIKKIVFNNKKIKDFNEIDINNYNEQQIIELINNIYILIKEKIKNDYKNYSEQNLKCIINVFNQIDNSLLSINYNEILNEFLSVYLKIIVTKIIDNKIKLSYLIIIINIVANSKKLNEKNYNNFIKNINIISKTFQKRIDLVKIDVESLNLHLNNNNKNLNKNSIIKDIINNSIKELEFINIKKEIFESYVEIVTKLINFFENNKNFIEIENIDLLINNINHNIKIDEEKKNCLLDCLNNLNNFKSELKNK